MQKLNIILKRIIRFRNNRHYSIFVRIANCKTRPCISESNKIKKDLNPDDTANHNQSRVETSTADIIVNQWASKTEEAGRQN